MTGQGHWTLNNCLFHNIEDIWADISVISDEEWFGEAKD